MNPAAPNIPEAQALRSQIEVAATSTDPALRHALTLPASTVNLEARQTALYAYHYVFKQALETWNTDRVQALLTWQDHTWFDAWQRAYPHTALLALSTMANLHALDLFQTLLDRMASFGVHDNQHDVLTRVLQSRNDAIFKALLPHVKQNKNVLATAVEFGNLTQLQTLADSVHLPVAFDLALMKAVSLDSSEAFDWLNRREEITDSTRHRALLRSIELNRVTYVNALMTPDLLRLNNHAALRRAVDYGRNAILDEVGNEHDEETWTVSTPVNPVASPSGSR